MLRVVVMASIPSLYCLLLFSCLLIYSSHASGAERRRLHTMSSASVQPAATDCPSISSAAAVGGDSLQVFHRHGPCSPLGLQPDPNHAEILRQDQSRVDSLHGRVFGATQQGKPAGLTIPDKLGASFNTMEYVVTVGFGTPTRNFTVILDTGSDLSWIQCEPCVLECYQQNEPLFDPSQSSTYANVSCSSADCPLVGDYCDGSACVYSFQYGDNSSTSGYFARDSLTLTSSGVLQDFKFGCGVMNRGNFGAGAGVLGLGRSRVSLASQASHKYGGGFSYCLPPSVNSTGYLTFGTGRRFNNVKFTPLLSKPVAPNLYFVELVGMSVGGLNLSIPPAVFADGGTIIDSGTVISRLPPSAYSVLREEFQRQMTGYPSAPPYHLLDTCYNLTGVSSVYVPTVALHFGGGVSIDVDQSGILFVASVSQACLAFAGNTNGSSFSVVGNMQQLGFDVVYDLGRGLIGFGPGGCS